MIKCKALYLLLAALSLPACSDSDDAKPTACKVAGIPVLAAEGALVIDLNGYLPELFTVRATSAGDYTATTARATRRGDGARLDVVFDSLPVGEAILSVQPRGGSSITCTPATFVAPGYPEVVTREELSGLEIRSDSGDLDRDGDLDFVTSNGWAWINDGQAAFEAIRLFDDQTDRIAIADMNGDGKADVIAWNRRGGGSIAKGYVLIGEGGNKWTNVPALKTAFLTGSYGEAAVGDLDDDGYADTVTVSANGLWIRWSHTGTLEAPVRIDPALGPEVRGFGSGESTQVYLSTIKILDVDGDGRLDLYYGRIALARQTAVRTFSVKADLYSLPADCNALVGNDNCPRIVGFHPTPDGALLMAVLFHNNRMLKGVSPQESSFDGTWFGEGDWNADGVTDLIGFGENGTPQGMAYLSGAQGATVLDPFFGEQNPGNVNAVLIGDFDLRSPTSEALLISGFKTLVVYRQTEPDSFRTR